MFLRLVKKANDHVSVRIVENTKKNGKVKQTTVCCIGHCHKENVKKLESLKRIGEEMVVKIKNDILPALPGLEEATHAPQPKKPPSEFKDDIVYINHLKEEGRINVGIGDIYGEVYDQLNLFDSIDRGYNRSETNTLLKEMVLSRIHRPSSKRQSLNILEREKLLKYDLDKVYRMMDKIYKSEENIKSKIVNKTLELFEEKITVAFFDVTTLYFESFCPDGLRENGYSKDNKFKETQVMLALMTTTEGVPLSYELFPGNTYEGSTLISTITNLRDRYDIGDAFVIADRGMFTQSNLKELDKMNVQFIISAKLRGMSKEWKEQICSDFSQDSLESQDAYKLKEYDFEGRRLIVQYSTKRASKDKKDRERLLERVNKRLKNGKIPLSQLIDNKGSKKYLKIEKGKQRLASLDETKILEDQKWDGLYGVISTDRRDISAKVIFERHGGLWEIENAFRINKHDLKMRPIYHWTPKRIKAHILICFIAYGLVSFVKYQLLKAKIKLSFAKIREELSYMQRSILRDKKTGRRFLLPSRCRIKVNAAGRNKGEVRPVKIS